MPPPSAPTNAVLEFEGQGCTVAVLAGSSPLALAFWTNTTATNLSFPIDSPGRFFRVKELDKLVMLAWDPSPPDEIVTYRVYYGPQSRQYTNFVPASELASKVFGLQPGLCYFAVTAVNSKGLESDYSSEVGYYVPPLRWVPAKIIVH